MRALIQTDKLYRFPQPYGMFHPARRSPLRGKLLGWRCSVTRRLCSGFGIFLIAVAACSASQAQSGKPTEQEECLLQAECLRLKASAHYYLSGLALGEELDRLERDYRDRIGKPFHFGGNRLADLGQRRKASELYELFITTRDPEVYKKLLMLLQEIQSACYAPKQ
jgi:hypothetical protein